MQLLRYLARLSFKTAPDGSRRLYLDGTWSRPYLIPDAETEERLITRLLQLLAVVIGIVTVVPFVGNVTGITQLPYGFIGMLGFMLVAMRAARQMLFGAEVRNLERGRSRLALRGHPRGFVERQHVSSLVVLIAAGLALAALGVIMLINPNHGLFAWLVFSISAAFAAASTSLLFLKLSRQAHDNGAPALPGAQRVASSE